MAQRLKTIYEKHEQDYETGELKSTTWVRARTVTTEQFMRTYVQDIGLLAKCSGAEISTVLCSFKYVDWNTNEIVLNNMRRNEIATCGGMTINTVYSAIQRLVKKNIFVKFQKKLLLNPTLFFFGDDPSRMKLFELKLKYEIQ